MSATAPREATGWSAGQTLDLGEGRSLHLVRRGAGAPVVLIHGAMVDHQDWTLAADAADLPGDLIAVDRPGHGLSRRPRFEGSLQSQAAQLREGLHALGLSRPIMAGHSLGAAVALTYAAEFPDDVEGLLLLGPIAFPEFRPIEHSYLAPRAVAVAGPAWAASASVTSDLAFWPAVSRLMFAPQQPPPAWDAAYPTSRVMRTEATVSEGEDAAALMLSAARAASRYDRVTAPVTVLYGDRDKVADPSRHAVRIPSRIPHARLHGLEGIGHMVHHAAPQAVAAALREMTGR